MLSWNIRCNNKGDAVNDTEFTISTIPLITQSCASAINDESAQRIIQAAIEVLKKSL